MRTFLTFLTLIILTVEIFSQWTRISAIPDVSAGLVYVSSNTIFFTATGGRLFTSTDGGTSWNEKAHPCLSVGGFIQKAGVLFIVGDDALRSLNSGQTWTQINNGLSLGSYTCMDLTTVNNKLFIATSDGLFISSDDGNNWSKINFSWINFNIQSLDVSGDTIFLVTAHPQEVYTSSSDGNSWTRLSTTGLTSFNSNRTISVIDSDIYLGNWGSGVYRSAVNGTAWILFNSGLPSPVYVRNIIGIQSNIIIGTYGQGIFLSTNKGSNWSSINAGLPSNYFDEVVMDNNYLYAASHVGFEGLWRRPLAGLITDIADNDTKLPFSFSLEQNYPNPFNPNTVISYQLPVSGFVTLKIYDLLGREVETLVNEYRQSGFYKSQFSIHKSQLSSGVYFYKLIAGKFSETKKMIYLK